MIKRGVIARGSFAEYALRQEAAHRGWWPFAYTLLADIEKHYSSADDALLNRLYESMRAGKGVYKITQSGRFACFDEQLASYLENRMDLTKSLCIHDMAASNAITSIDLFERLRQQFEVELTASDYYDKIYIVRPEGSGWQIVFDVDAEPLQFVGYGFVLSAYRTEPLRYVSNRLLQSSFARGLLARAQNILEASRGDTRAFLVDEVSLFHPRARALAAADCGFSVLRDNLFGPVPSQWDVIRIMNALTPHHFSVDRIRDALKVISANLTQGGLLLVGRNADEDDGRLRASAFVRRGDGLERAFDASEPYELASLVAEIVPSPTSR